jgi:hypothetical protein
MLVIVQNKTRNNPVVFQVNSQEEAWEKILERKGGTETFRIVGSEAPRPRPYKK